VVASTERGSVRDPEARRDLIAIGVSAQDLLIEHGLPVVWKGADFFLAEWSLSVQQNAHRLEIPFEVLATDFGDTRTAYVFELLDDEPPAEWHEHALFNIGRKWVLELPPDQAADWSAAGYPAIEVRRRDSGWDRPAPQVAFDCSFDSAVADLLGRTSQPRWMDWIEKLSGEEQVVVGGVDSTILTRYSSPMFSGSPIARGYEFTLEQVQRWHHPPLLIEQDPYTGSGGQTWKNLVVTLPGETLSGEVVMLTAHLDSLSGSTSTYAPGADDNGTGSASLLEAARLLRQFRFDRTIKIIWFTGEEDGLLGSEAYVTDHPTSSVVGVVNLDMFGWDSDADRCFEIHAGTLPQSIDVANCFRDSTTAYSLGLSHDFLTTGATDRSDHASFWQVNVGAIEIAENFFNDGLAGGCVGQDRNPNYHTTADTVAGITGTFGFDIMRSAMATLAAMAGPLGACFDEAPTLAATPGESSVALSWTPLEDAESYRVYRSTQGCLGQWFEIGETRGTAWLDDTADEATTYDYRIEAVEAGGLCVSDLSNCASAVPTVHHAATLTTEWIDVCPAGGAGSGDGIVDPGESVVMPVTLKNDGNAGISEIIGSLSTFSEDLEIIDPHADWPDLLPGGLAQSLPNHFGFQVSPSAVCGTLRGTTIDLAYAQGANATGAVVPIGGTVATPLLEVDFSEGIPFGWTIIDGGSGGAIASAWTTANPGIRSIDPPFDTTFAIVDSDEAGPGADQDEQLISPSFDATDCLTVVLEFSNQFHWFSGSQDETADVDVRLGESVNWTNVLRQRQGDDGYPTPVTKSVDITSIVAANPGDVQIRFHYHQAHFEWWWAIDNVNVECTRSVCTPCAGTVGAPGEPGASAPLLLRRENGDVILEWDPPDAGCDTADYAIYRGELSLLPGSGYSHDVALSCAVGSNSFSIPEDDPRLSGADYFLVVADNGFQEGSYGRNSQGTERPAPSSACLAAQNLAVCLP
jgi:leucyl aminopeptidase